MERILCAPIDYGLLIQHRSALCKRYDKVLSLKRSAERPYLNKISLGVGNVAGALPPRFRGRLQNRRCTLADSITKCRINFIKRVHMQSRNDR